MLERVDRPRIARAIHRFSGLIILAWLAVTVVVTVAVPPLEMVEREKAVSLSPVDAPSYRAAERIAAAFNESTSSAVAVVVLEGEEPLGDDAHRYYDDLIRQFREDPAHVQHIQDFWGDPLTRGAAESSDGKAAYVQVTLAGETGQALGNESVKAVQDIVDRTPAPAGVKAYVTGAAPIIADMGESGNRTVILITVVSLTVIFVMLLLTFRSVVTTLIILLTVGIELQVARGIIAFLGMHDLVGLSTFVVNLVVSLGIAAGTDYGIFFFGRYKEARAAGEDRESAFYTTYRSVAKVVLASGVTIAGAIFCLSFARLPFFQPLGLPGALGVLICVAVALTLVPAILALGSRRFGLFEPRRQVHTYRWRRIGTAVVRWPVPILIATIALSLIGLLTLPGYKPSYNDQKFLPQDIPANQGYVAASRHFPASSMTAPDLLMIESDHDMRNSADMLVLNKLAKALFAVPGIANVQSITRPEGTQLAHTTIPFLMSGQNAGQMLAMPFQKERMADMLTQADELSNTIAIMQRMYGIMQELVDTTHRMVESTHELQDTTNELRDHLADFQDFWRPLINYLYWEPHCYGIPLCHSIRALFDALDGVNEITETMDKLVDNLDQLDALLPQILLSFPQMIATMESTRTMMLTMHSTMSGTIAAMEESSDNVMAMGKAFDAANNDESFYLPPEIFDNEDFKRVLKIFLSEDGKAARFLITQKGDPISPEGISRVDPIHDAAEEALKGTPLENSRINLAGSAASVKDLVVGSTYDLLIAGVSALCLIFIIMLLMTRSVIAALVIVGTVALSLGASFGLSILIWQHILGLQIHWMVLALSVMILLAVGSDYNLLLVSRMKEEIGAGINTGIIRAMGGTGRVVTAAGLVFAATMASMLVSDLLTIGQLGSTIAVGLLFDTLVVRAFMVPSIAAILGRWFWWPQRVRQRPASGLLRPIGPRPLVRSLLLRD
ncbi:RND family transporter [Mycolicibacterium sp. 120270]|nr:RND family transporter [Mycolicibacterium sp. 120270]MDX1883987.1 RND family transporter [Mycolicibacterium sp. 120270]